MPPIMSHCRIHCTTKMLQVYILHLSHHPYKCLIILWNLHWKDGWRWWNLKNPWSLLSRNLLVSLSLNGRSLLHMNLWTMLHLNLRTTLLALLNRSHLPSNLLSNNSGSLLSSLPSCLLGNLLNSFLSGLSSCILNHLPQGILVNRWGCVLRHLGRYMIISGLTNCSACLRTTNSPAWWHLK
ncbi:LOW QUALITY PROTEIN: hypothetical protein N665_0101s0013 [Sinapis alba]|nr:LOW QUALITY PROTEIN: hypothetical protein N665_0101s0013 [Sinapis alba]